MLIQKFSYEDNENNFSCNAYVIGEENGECFVVDPGIDRPDVENYIRKKAMTLVAILLTHAHFDHVRGVNRLVSLYHPKVYICEEDKEALSNKKLNCTYFTNEPRKFDFGTIGVIDNEVIDVIGHKIKVIHTPFHTAGSVCYYVEDSKILFTGDTLFARSIGRSDLPGSETRKIRDSLEKLKKLPDNVVCYPGHDTNTSIGKEKLYNPYMHQ